ncbi:SWIB/MDM2 domain-containing protein, partial [Coemansia spiralis]
VTTLTPRIREILQCSDLATISAKKVRRQLEHEMSVSLDTYKGEIDEVIKQQFQQIHSETQQRQQAQQQYAQQQYAQGQMVYGVPTMPLQMPYAAPMPNMSPETPRKRGRPRKPENERKQQRKKRVLDPNRPKRQTGLSKPMKLSADLSAFLDQKYCARTDVVKNLWKYIKEHNLQDPEDKRYILCDAELKKLFATDRLYMYTMNKLLNEHLVKP